MIVRSSIAIVLALGLVLGLALPVGPAAADQDDPRLEALFARLKSAPNAPAAQEVEASIWHIWLQSDDNVIGLLMGQGINAMSRNDMRAALGKFDQIVKIAPDFAEGWNKRATVHYLLGNYQESLHNIEKTLKLEPRHFGALSGRGLVYSALEQWRPALESFEKALEVNPHMTGARTNAEAIRQQIGDQDI